MYRTEASRPCLPAAPFCPARRVTDAVGGFERYREWLLKNSLFVSNSQKLGDRKCLPNPRRSIVGPPDAILFLRISRVRVFQQPRDLSTTDSWLCIAGLALAQRLLKRLAAFQSDRGVVSTRIVCGRNNIVSLCPSRGLLPDRAICAPALLFGRLSPTPGHRAS